MSDCIDINANPCDDREHETYCVLAGAATMLEYETRADQTIFIHIQTFLFLSVLSLFDFFDDCVWWSSL